MIVSMDEDVQKVVAFMAGNVPANKLISVAQAVNDLARPLWGHHKGESITPISLTNDPILACDQCTQ